MARRVVRTFEFWVGLFAAAIIVPMIYAKTIEPIWYPVISRLEITAAYADPLGTVLQGSATRHRKCSWVRTRWWLGRRGEQRVPVEVEYRDKPQVRETGETTWSGIVIVDLTPEQTLRNSHADAVYRCWAHWPWSRIELAIPFYDGLGQDIALLNLTTQREILEQVEELQNEVERLTR